MMTPDFPIILQAGSLVAHVHPACGGRIGRFFMRGDDDEGDVDFLMPLPAQSFEPHAWPKAGCFPMLPFGDKLAHNRLDWNGESIAVAESETAPWFHGWGLRLPWEVVARTEASCEMQLHVTANRHWPWAYTGKLCVTLDARGLEIALSVSNHSPAAMPANIGIHPYFRMPPEARARVGAERAWVADSQRPGAFKEYATDAAAEWLHDGSPPEGAPPNLFYELWDRKASISYPKESVALAISSDCADFLTAFAPAAGMGYFCLEPVSDLPGVFKRAIASGESLRVQARFDIELQP